MSEKVNYYREIVSGSYRYWAFDSTGAGDQYVQNFSDITFVETVMKPSIYTEEYVSNNYETIDESTFMEEFGGQNAEYASNVGERGGKRPELAPH